ncbi:MAG TPA: SDR family NAD(P)-dependent oxidoreductase [Actinocrinis sp.]|nr:SDR family NAD(P)-dependent oxidoreductase [Actinocrinis sp.]
MELAGKVAVVTGGGNGIGAQLARRFAAEGAAAVLVADLDGTAAEAVAAQVREFGARASALVVDVAEEAQVRGLVEAAEREFGPVDLMCSNAGIATGHGIDATDAEFELAWRVNTMAHVYAARAVVPGMVERGCGYLLNTCSAAGLLMSPGDAPYTLSKNAAVAFAEYLAVAYGDQGVKVSALCPLGVRTALLQDGLDSGNPAALAVAASGELLTVEQVADCVIEGLAAERFLILPHPEVAKHIGYKAADRDRWLAGVRKLVATT